MARLPRLHATGFAQLVAMQLRSPGQSHLFSDSSLLGDLHFRHLFGWLGKAALQEGAAIHGWSLTPKAIYLLATPSHDKCIPSLVQSLGRNLAAQLKTGSVFSGRYRSMIPQPGLWVLPSLIWLERQPLREELTTDPEAWPWSSARVHTGAPGIPPSWFQPHPDYWACGNTPFDRQAFYRRRLLEGARRIEEKQIEYALHGQWGLGETLFLTELEKMTHRRVSPAPRGRPRKSDGASPF